MPLDLARRRQGSESRELVPQVGIEPLDGLDQSEVADLHDVVQRLAPVLELASPEVDQVPIGVNQFCANAIALCGTRGLFVGTAERPHLTPGRPRLSIPLLSFAPHPRPVL